MFSYCYHHYFVNRYTENFSQFTSVYVTANSSLSQYVYIMHKDLTGFTFIMLRLKLILMFDHTFVMLIKKLVERVMEIYHFTKAFDWKKKYICVQI